MEKIIAWIKQNKIAALAVLGGAFLFFSKQGNGESGGGEEVDAEGARVVTIPVGMGEGDEMNEGVYDSRYQDDIRDSYWEGVEDAKDRFDEDDETGHPDEPDDDGGPKPDRTGVTVNGRFFPKATGSTLVRIDNQRFQEYLIKFEGHVERWQYRRDKGWAKSWHNPTTKRDKNENEPPRDRDKKRDDDKPDRRKRDRRKRNPRDEERIKKKREREEHKEKDRPRRPQPPPPEEFPDRPIDDPRDPGGKRPPIEFDPRKRRPTPPPERYARPFV